MEPNPVTISAARVAYKDGALYSTGYGDIYHSADGAIEEARHVFLGGNGIPDRFHENGHLTVVETGFGCGLNFLSTWDALSQSGARCRLDFVSAEKHPFGRDDLSKILGLWPQFDTFAGQLLRAYPPLIAGFHRLYFDDGRVCLTLLFGDATEMLAELDARANALFLDGFAPARNPDMWSEALFEQLGRIAAPGATAATYSAASAVRTGLERAGFVVGKKPGFGRKRDMLTAKLAGERPRLQTQRKAIVIGAGIAGASCAFALARRGLEVELLDREAAPGRAASFNPAAVVRPFLSLDTGVRNRFGWAAFDYAVRLYRELDRMAECGWRETGVLQLGKDREHWNKLVRAVDLTGVPSDLARLVSAREATALCGAPVNEDGIWFAPAGFVDGRELCNALVTSSSSLLVTFRGNVEARTIGMDGGFARVVGADGRDIASGDLVVLANGMTAQALFPGGAPWLRGTRGQVTAIPSVAAQLRAPVCREGYVTPQVGRYHYVGATFDKGRTDAAIENSDRAINRKRAGRILPGVFPDEVAGIGSDWAGVRCASPDRLPVIGQVDATVACCLAMGSRGFSWAPLAGETVASLVSGAPAPLERTVLQRLSATRFVMPSAKLSR